MHLIMPMVAKRLDSNLYVVQIQSPGIAAAFHYTIASNEQAINFVLDLHRGDK